MIRSAVISPDGKYRYTLSRIWDEDKPIILFVMLSPSTADAEKDDRTMLRVINFTQSWGYGGVHVVNLYALRNMKKDSKDPMGADNVKHVRALVKLTEKVVYAWGHNKVEPKWLRDLVEEPYCIDVSTKGIPMQPLFLKKDLQLIKFERAPSSDL